MLFNFVVVVVFIISPENKKKETHEINKNRNGKMKGRNNTHPIDHAGAVNRVSERARHGYVS